MSLISIQIYRYFIFGIQVQSCLSSWHPRNLGLSQSRGQNRIQSNQINPTVCPGGPHSLHGGDTLCPETPCLDQEKLLRKCFSIVCFCVSWELQLVGGLTEIDWSSNNLPVGWGSLLQGPQGGDLHQKWNLEWKSMTEHQKHFYKSILFDWWCLVALKLPKLVSSLVYIVSPLWVIYINDRQVFDKETSCPTVKKHLHCTITGSHCFF